MISIRAKRILATRKRTEYLVVAVAAATVHRFDKFPRPNSYPTFPHFFLLSSFFAAAAAAAAATTADCPKNRIEI